MNKIKKMNKIQKVRLFQPLYIQLEDKYYQNGKNVQIQKIYANFCFLVQILAKIIINFSDFSVFPIYVIVLQLAVIVD